MAKFEISYAKTHLNERGYTLVPEDGGNWTGGSQGVGVLIGTKDGISAPVLCAYLKRTATAQEMKDLPEAIKKAIYRSEYWNVIEGDKIRVQEAADSLYDSAVNFGCRRGIILAQRSLDIPETGKMDDLTMAKINLQ